MFSPITWSSTFRFVLSLSVYANTAHTSSVRNVGPPTVTLQNGTLEGLSNSAYSQDFFLGVPYAQPPVGSLRFRQPQPAAAWTGTRAAREYGSWCYGFSTHLVGFSQNNTGPMSEDCLTLNVIRPSHTQAKSKLPVAVWIHGGGYDEGSANDQRYNGSFLVQESVEMGTPIMFVSFNYRLGIFGFLAGPVLEKSGDTNIGIHDQRMALAWIQENISQFGGDPNHVTIFGESAGAASVGFHLIANGGRDSGLFHAAIAESGGPFAYAAFSNATARSKDFQAVLQSANCTTAADTLQCLKDVPAEVLNTFGPLIHVFPMIDGTLVEDFTTNLMAKGAFRKVPLLIGTNRNEGATLVSLNHPSGPVTSESDFDATLQIFSPAWTIPKATLAKWSEEYETAAEDASIGGLGTVAANPGPKYGALFGKTSLWIGDSLFIAGRRYANQMWSRYSTDSYAYFFDTPAGYLNETIYGAAHYSEVSFVFNNVQGVGYDINPYGTSDQQKAEKLKSLAKVMSRMWISFFVHKTPNKHGLHNVVHWPEYAEGNATHIVLNAEDGLSTASDTWRQAAIQMFIDLGILLRR